MVDVRYSKERNGYIKDTHSIVKSMTLKGSAKWLNLYLCQHCRCGFFFYTCLGPVSQKGLRPGASLVRNKSGPKPQNQTKLRIFIKKIYMQYDTCKNYLVCMLAAFCF